MFSLRRLFTQPTQSDVQARSVPKGDSGSSKTEQTTRTPTQSGGTASSSTSTAGGSRPVSAIQSLKQNLAASMSTSSGTLDKGKRRQVPIKLEEGKEVVTNPPPSSRRPMVKLEEAGELFTNNYVVGTSVDTQAESSSHKSAQTALQSGPARSSSPLKLKRKAEEEECENHIPSSPTHLQAVKMEEREEVIPSSNASVRRRGGLLTPHASFGDALLELPENSDDVKDEFIDPFPLQETPPRAGPSKAPARTLIQPVSESVSIGSSRTPSRSSTESISSLTQRLRAAESSRPRGLFVSPTQSPSGSVKSKSSFIRLGEKEAGSIEDDLALLARERERLEKELEEVKRAEAELLSMFTGSPGSFHSSLDFEELDKRNVQEAGDRLSRLDEHERGSPSKRIKLEERNTVANPGPSRTSNDAESSFSDGPTKVSYSYTLNPSDISTSSRPSASVARSSDSITPSHMSESTYMSAPESLSWSQHRDALVDHSGDSYFVFFDLETTDAVKTVQKIRILEVAVRITDKNFIPLDNGLTSLVHWPLTADELKQGMSDKVREMHEKSGLFKAYADTPPDDRLTLKDVEKRVCRYLHKHQISRGVLAGAGIAFDRGVVRQHMEKLDELLGHQIFDTTSLWLLIRRKYNRSKRFATSCSHRAMDDINGAIREARVYSEVVMRAPNDVQWPNKHDGV